ncbi:MAG: hypothetical protein Pars2KO_25480 [Parasphingorhabdus sp.]
MLVTQLSLSFGSTKSKRGKRHCRTANDNLSREQELFEKCVQRELGGLVNENSKQNK